MLQTNQYMRTWVSTDHDDGPYPVTLLNVTIALLKVVYQTDPSPQPCPSLLFPCPAESCHQNVLISIRATRRVMVHGSTTRKHAPPAGDRRRFRFGDFCLSTHSCWSTPERRAVATAVRYWLLSSLNFIHSLIHLFIQGFIKHRNRCYAITRIKKVINKKLLLYNIVIIKWRMMCYQKLVVLKLWLRSP